MLTITAEQRAVLKTHLGRDDDEIATRLAANARIEADERYAIDKREYDRLMIAYGVAMDAYREQMPAWAVKQAEYDAAYASWQAADPDERPEWTRKPPREPILPVEPVAPAVLTDQQAFDAKLAEMSR